MTLNVKKTLKSSPQSFFFTAKDSKQLTFMYLANDVIQNSKKKGPEYGKEFGEVLVESFKHMAKTGINTKTKHSLHRILSIWEERGVYDSQKIQEFKEAVDPNDALPKKVSKRKSVDVEAVKTPEKKAKVEGRSKHERRRSETKEVDGHLETHTTLSPKTPPGDPPEPEELIKALLELEASASSDEAVRERIASLPPEVSEVQLLSKLEGKMTPYHRINFVITLVNRLIILQRWLKTYKRNEELIKILKQYDLNQHDMKQCDCKHK